MGAVDKTKIDQVLSNIIVLIFDVKKIILAHAIAKKKLFMHNRYTVP